jgi:PAS domain S-box-containing protein
MGPRAASAFLSHETVLDGDGTVALAVSLLVLAVCLLNISLRRLVALKTAELQNELEERTRVESALIESREKYRKLIDTTATGYVIIDSQGIVLDANQPYVHLAGRQSLEDVLGHPVLEWTAETDLQKSLDAIHQAFTQGTARGLEVDYVDRTGKRTPVEINATRVQTGTESQVLTLCRDISERRQAEFERRRLEEQLAQAQKMESIGRLAGGVAHDFNNMLAVILGHSELMLQDLSPDSALAGDLSQIIAAGERARDLTRQLLAFSRKQILDVKILDINPVVQGMEKMIRRLLGEDIEVFLHLSPDIGLIKADPSQIEQVLLNLCVNSRDAMPGGGMLVIETRTATLDAGYQALHPGVQVGPYVLLCVSDTGEGMDQATMKQIFDPFFTTKEKGKGTGLGLATVYGIVKQHGGEILVYSEPGHSTTFKIFFPQVNESPCAETQEEPSGIMRLGHGETLLVIEDEEAVRRMTCQMLERIGYRFSRRERTQCLEIISRRKK